MKRTTFLGLAFATGLTLCSAVPEEGAEWTIAPGETETVSTALSLAGLSDNGVLTLESGASLTVNGTIGSIAEGEGQTGSLVIKNGATYTQVGQDTATYPGNTYGLALGNLGGQATVTVEAGGLLKVEDGRIIIGRNGGDDKRTLGSKGVLNIFGTVSARAIECSAWYPKLDSAQYGSYNVDDLGLSAEINLEEGGVLETGKIFRNDAGRVLINFKGGTLRATTQNDDFIASAGAMQWRIADGRNLVFDTQGNHVRILKSGVQTDFFTIAGNGGLVKKGSGYLQFCFPAAANTFSGPIVVEAGILSLGRKLLEGQTVSVHKGAQFYPADPEDLPKIAYEDPAEAPSGLYSVQSRLYDGLNLAGMGPTYETTRLGGPIWGWGAQLFGAVAVPSTIDVAHPLELVGQGNLLELSGTGLEKVPLSISGTGAFTFFGARTNETDSVLSFTGSATAEQRDEFVIQGTGESQPKVTVSGGSTFKTGRLRVGHNGRHGELAVSNGAKLEVAGDVVLGGNVGDRVPTRGKVTVENATVEMTGELKFAPTTKTDGTDRTTLYNEFTVGAGATVRVGGRITRNDDARSRLIFSGGHVSPQKNEGDFFYTGQDGVFEIQADGSDIELNLGTFKIGMVDNHTHVFGTGGLYVRGDQAGSTQATLTIGKPGLTDFSVDYKGDTTIRDATLSLGASGLLHDGEGYGKLVGDNGVLDLNGNAAAVNSVAGGLTVKGPGTLTVGADGSSFTFGAKAEDVSLVKKGAGTMTVARPLDADLTILGGTVALKGPVAFRSYRFKVEGVKASNANSMQLAELKLFSGEADVTRPYAKLDWTQEKSGNQNYPANENPALLVDGKIETKWLDFRAAPSAAAADHERVWLKIDYAQPILLTGYAWYTANDSTERDPAAWRLQGSNDDGATWVDLDVQTGRTVTNDRRVLAFEAALEKGSLRTASTLAVAAGATLRVAEGSLSVTTLENSGTVEIAAGAQLKALGGTLNGAVTGAGSLEVAGATTLTGASGYTGATHVTGGTLDLGAVAGATRGFDGRYFRLTIVRSNGGQEDQDWKFQASEFQLYAADGSMQNRGLAAQTAGTAATALPAGSFCCAKTYNSASDTETPELMFDGDTATKWCCGDRIDGSAGSEHILTMRLADDARPVTSYNFFTANDYVRRSPSDWTLEGSRDGITWETLDARNWAPHTTFTDRSKPNADSIKFKPMNNGTAYTFDAARPPAFGGKFFRFTFKKTSGNTIFQLSELGLYDVRGDNAALGLKAAASGAAATELEPGEYAKGNTYAAGGNGSEDADKLFDDKLNTKVCWVSNNMGGAEANWRVLTMRLADDALPVCGYLFTTANDSLERSPCDWLVEGSFDGTTWTALDERTGVARPYCLYTAMNAGHPFAFASLASGTTLASASTLQVDAGAVVNVNDETARIGSLFVDFATGAGTINGFRPAADGTLTLVNVPPETRIDGLVVPLTVTEVSDVGALKNWTVVVDGVDHDKARIKIASDGKIVLWSKDVLVYVR